MILLGLMGIWALVVLAVLYQHGKNLCNGGIDALFWLGINCLIFGGIVQIILFGLKREIDPNSIDVICAKRNGYMEAYRIKGSNVTYSKCVHGDKE